MKVVKPNSSMTKFRIGLLLTLIVVATLTLTGLRAGAAGEVEFGVVGPSHPAANGTDSTIFMPLAISDHPFNTLFGYEYSSIGEVD